MCGCFLCVRLFVVVDFTFSFFFFFTRFFFLSHPSIFDGDDGGGGFLVGVLVFTPQGCG